MNTIVRSGNAALRRGRGIARLHCVLMYGFALIVLAAQALAADARRPATSSRLHEFFEQEWEYWMQQYPTRASSLGDRRWNDRWNDLSLPALQKRHEHRAQALEKIRIFRRNKLTPEDELNLDLFEKEYRDEIREFELGWHLLPLNQREGIQTAEQLADSLPFEQTKDYEDWLARLRRFPELVRQTQELMREGVRRRLVHPRVIMDRIPAQLDAQLVSAPEQSPFFRPFRKFPQTISTPEQKRLLEEARGTIAGGVLPAFREFKEFFVEVYLPACWPAVGIWQVPNGTEMYSFFARKFTTTDFSPDQIHELGLRETARIRQEMEKIKRQVGYSGTLTEFFQFLRSDPRFYFDEPQQLLDAYRALSKRIDPELVKIFKKHPRLPYGVEPIPDNIAPDTTTAYYREPAADGSRAGTYFVNLYKPATRPKYEMMALSLHEAVPGHHFQLSLAMELEDLPKFRRFGGYTAFIEGWALYAEHLGEELGLYDDPYSKFGQLVYEMWRAVRLVVDTGMHAKRWTREQAIQFFLDNAAKSELDIINEIDRYIAWPGQALAYKIGELKIKELRHRAEQQLKEKFQVADFHDALLSSGALPLDLLERKMERWIQEQQKSRAGDKRSEVRGQEHLVPLSRT